MSAKGKPCSMKGCSYSNETSGSFCVNCRSSLYRWSKRSPADLLKRTGKLNLYLTRLSSVKRTK